MGKKDGRTLFFLCGQNPDNGPGQDHRNDANANKKDKVTAPGLEPHGCRYWDQNGQDNTGPFCF